MTRVSALLALLLISREELMVNMAIDGSLGSSGAARLQDLEEGLGRWLQSQNSGLLESRLGQWKLLCRLPRKRPEKGEVLWRADILLKKTYGRALK